MTKMKHQIKARSELGWNKTKWSIARDMQPRDIEIVQARVIALKEQVWPTAPVILSTRRLSLKPSRPPCSEALLSHVLVEMLSYKVIMLRCRARLVVSRRSQSL